MMNPLLPDEIEPFLHRQIPMAKAMGVRLAQWDEEALVLEAPLELNHNHLGTGFGGSLAALATLAGYTLLWLELEDAAGHVVIRESRILYHKPVTGTLRAVTPRLPTATRAFLQQTYAEKGRIQWEVEVKIPGGNGQSCVTFTGVYVARPAGT